MGDARKIIKYFGFGTNKDLDMMVHMVGRGNLVGEPGKLIGYEVCIIVAKNIKREHIPPESPLKVSPKKIIIDNWGDDFPMYYSRPNPNAVAYGTIWDLYEDEIELVKEWELVDYGLQEEVNAMAMNNKGDLIQVETQALMGGYEQVDKVVAEENYESYIAPKDKMLALADKTRTDYLKRKSQGLK